MTRPVRGALAALLLTACAANGPPREAHIAVAVDVDRSAIGFPVYRIPALAVSRLGTLIAAYDGRPSMADLPSRIALVVRRSVDGGQTWLPRQLIRSSTGPEGFGDPSLLVDQVTGRIFLFHAASVRQGFFGAATGNRDDDPNVLHADVSWSDDDGVTWRHRRLTHEIKQPAWNGLFASSGAGIQLVHGPHAGRLVQQYVVRFQSANWAASAFSDDHGTTWHMGALAGPGLDENKSVELADGRLMLNSRARGFRRVAFSGDGGATWSAVADEHQLVDPANNAAIVRVDPQAPPSDPRAHWLLFSNTDHATERANLTLKLSCDDGVTWSAQRTIESGRAAYSTLVMLPHDRVGVLYERGDYEAITFVGLSLPSRSVRACRL